MPSVRSTNRAIARAELVAACVMLVALTTLAVVTFVALRGEREQGQARQQAEQMDRLRRSLWRMDSQLTSIIAREAARSPEQYWPFYPADRTQALRVNEQFETKQEGGGPTEEVLERDGRAGEESSVLVPSELLAQPDEVTKLHFQISAMGEFASPQVPRGRQREFAQLRFSTPYAIEHAEGKLRELQGLFARQAELRTEATQLARMQELQRIDGATAHAVGTKQFGQSGESDAAGGAGDARSERDSEGMAAASRSAGEGETTAQTQEMRAPPASSAGAGATGAQAASGATPGQPSGAGAGSGAVRAETASVPTANAATPTMQAQADFAARQSLARAANMQQEATTRIGSGRANDASGGADLLLDGTDEEALPTVVSQPAVRQQGFVPQWIVRERALPTGGSEQTELATPELVFIRTVEGPWGSVRQGFWLDWPLLEAQLLASVQDTAPGAMLRPVLAETDGAVPAGVPDDVLGRMLATVPAELVLASVAPARQEWTPLRTALVATWLLVLAAMLTLAWLARAADKLAENRGRFVTAVTHELRTPLTSFCLYSQMLADNMVQDDEAKREYARTLHAQSLRLSRIVESVLDYARLGRARRTLEPTTVGALRERVEPPLLSICRRSGLTLSVVPPPVGWAVAALRTDLDTIDRILTNLVDNACKYASDGSDARAELAWLVEGQTLVIRVRDYGPGIPAGDRDRVFKAFERGSAHAGGATPGLGLGLALSHALAQEIGASLRLAELGAGEAGACFELRVPLYA